MQNHDSVQRWAVEIGPIEVDASDAREAAAAVIEALAADSPPIVTVYLAGDSPSNGVDIDLAENEEGGETW